MVPQEEFSPIVRFLGTAAKLQGHIDSYETPPRLRDAALRGWTIAVGQAANLDLETTQDFAIRTNVTTSNSELRRVSMNAAADICLLIAARELLGGKASSQPIFGVPL